MFSFTKSASLALSLVSVALSLPAPAAESFFGVDGTPLVGSHFGSPGNQTFDYVVVGGGTAGLAIASRLAEDESKSVAVIEAGSFYEIGNSNFSEIPAYAPAFSGKSSSDVSPLVDWAFQTTPQKGFDNTSSHYARGKCLGGSSARNYLTYQRPTEQSLDQWASAVGDDSYQLSQFKPYYDKAVTFTPPLANLRAANGTPEYDSDIGNQGPLSVTFGHYAQAFTSWAQAAFKQLGISPIKGLTGGQLIGSSYQLLAINAQTAVRDSSETSYLRKVGLPRSNLIVYQSTLAKRIIFDASKKATGVEIDIGATGRETFILSANLEVILSAGVFQSPQLLMVSGVGPAATLKQYNIPVVADIPGVGQKMWDHVLGGPSYRVNVLTTSALSNPAYGAQAAADFHANPAQGMLTDAGADMLAFEKLPQNLRANFSSSAQKDLASFPADWPEVEYIPISAYWGYEQHILSDGPTDGYNYATIVAALVAPLSRGTVSISSADAADPPVIDPGWLTHTTDQAVAVAAYKRTRTFFESEAMKPVLVGGEYFPGPQEGVVSDAQILAFIRKSFGTVFHAACTCKMGKLGDPDAVVDNRARVMGGIQGLRVVDASSFPILPPGHPVATIYALAEKIADDIKTNKA